MGTTDFRVGAKIFATLGNPDAAWGVIGLTPDQQALLIETTPKVFAAVPGGWGARGWTRVRLASADRATVQHALSIAWRSRASKSLLRRAEGQASGRTSTKLDAGLNRSFARVRKAARATKLPGIVEATSYGTPSLKVGAKFLMRVKDADTYVFRCTMEEKAFLMEAEPAVYFETAHYVGWPAVLVRASAASDAELAHCVARAWRLQAPKKLTAERARPAAKAKGSGRK
jgi:hypothetical protein